MDLKFWQSKKVLITGHTGFKGSWLSLWLQCLGAEVFGYALKPPTEPTMFRVANVADGMTSITGDVLNQADLHVAIAEYRPEIVFHLAAQPLVRESYRKPVETYATNVMGLVHLLEALRQTGGARAVVCVTSDKCYQNRQWLWGYREEEPMGGYDPYSSSKGCAELVAAAYRNSFFNKDDYSRHGVAIATARAGNVIGGGDWAKDRLIPDVIRSAVKTEDIVLRNPHAIRPWQHVLDALRGYLMLAEYLYEEGPRFGDGWNFAPNESYTVSQVVDQFVSLWGERISTRYENTPQPHEDPYMMLDSTKARVQLGWKPLLDLSSSLGWIVEWIKYFQTGADMCSVSKAQLERYVDLSQSSDLLDQVVEPIPRSTDSDLCALFDAILIIRDGRGRIQYWNQSADETYGWKYDEAVGTISHDLLQTKFSIPLREIELQLDNLGHWEGELVHTRKNGTAVRVKSRWLLKREHGKGVGSIVEINQICSDR